MTGAVRDWSVDRQLRTPARIGAVVLPFATCAILSTVRDSVTAATAVLVLVLWVVAAAATPASSAASRCSWPTRSRQPCTRAEDAQPRPMWHRVTPLCANP
jgi:hypothetical protein